ncbi:glycosyltransferase family 2 protein [Pedobacter antarcticus]|uniref:glycosyltransferase family 2 protein n=1 Tax=Pedobacter antarcticus TaxID=34086 RepID=UPI00088B3F54|nr:glycosyltransferase family 2 protein [Pedobacter antarcticus]SDL39929.1 Glycosyltransferase involved in cell wall bisynthesis [Pedobacter antarcticus]
MEFKPVVSIVVPIYRVEPFIEKCVHSLLNQTYQNIEFIFVNDDSPDNSMMLLRQIIEKYPQRQDQVRIFEHKMNKGLPAARNTGLSAAQGDYIFHCDSDDWVNSNMIEDMISIAIKENSDIVYSDWFLTFEEKERYMTQPSFSSADICIRGILEGSMKYNVWNKLIRKRIYHDNEISFPEGNGMGEDMTIIKLFCHADRVSYISKAYYHYMQTNPNAFTKGFSEQHLKEVRFNMYDTIRYIETIFGANFFFKELQYFKLNVKLPFLIGSERRMYDIWREWFTEAHPYIAKNPAFSSRTRLIQYAAMRKQDWLIKLYSYFLDRVVYGWFYR